MMNQIPASVALILLALACQATEPSDRSSTVDTEDPQDTQDTLDSGDPPTTPAPTPFAAIEQGIDRGGFDYDSFALAEPDPNTCMSACISDSECLAFTYTEPEFFEPGGLAVCFLKNAVPGRSEVQGVWSGVVRAGVELGLGRLGKVLPGGALSTTDPVECRAACVMNEACDGWVGVTVAPAAIGCALLEQAGPPEVSIEPNRASGLVRERGLEYSTDRPGSDIGSVSLDDPSPEACRVSCLDNPSCVAFTLVYPRRENAPAECFHKGAPAPAPTYLQSAVSGVLER